MEKEPGQKVTGCDEFSYLYAIGWDKGWMKVGVSGDPLKRLRHLRCYLGGPLELHCVIQLPMKIVMMVEVCAHSLLWPPALEKECFFVTAEEAFPVMLRAINLVENGSFGPKDASAYWRRTSSRGYCSQRYRSKCISNIQPDTIFVPKSRVQPVILTHQQAMDALQEGISLHDATCFRADPDRPVPRKARRATLEKIEQAKQLIRSGMTVPEAGKVVGLKPSTIYLHLPGGAAALRAEDEIDLPDDDSDKPE